MGRAALVRRQRSGSSTLPETVHATGIGAQFQGRASRLRQARPDENPLAGGMRTTMVKLLWDADTHAGLPLKVVLLGSVPLLI